MTIRNSIFSVCAALLISVCAYGQDNAKPGSGEGPSQDRNGQPLSLKPEPADPVLRYTELKPLWDKAVTPADEVLLGNWKMIAQGVNNCCGILGRDFFDREGVKNADDSITELDFAKTDSPSLPGLPPRSRLSVKFVNLGERATNQGPYLLQATEPQFASWAYSYSEDTLSKDVFIDYSCRVFESDNSKLICAITVRMVAHPVGEWSKETRTCAAKGNFSAIRVFSKIATGS